MSKRKSTRDDLLESILHGDYKILSNSIENQSESNKFNELFDDENNNLLHNAVKSESIECVRTVLKIENIDVRAKNNSHETPFDLAIKLNCSREINELLVSAIVPYEFTYNHQHSNENGENSDCEGIFLAIEENSLELLKYIVENTKHDGKLMHDGRNLLIYVIQNMDFDVSYEIFDYLFAIIYGENYDLIDLDFFNVFLDRFEEYSNEYVAMWFLEKCYFNDRNKLKSIVNELRDKMYERIENINYIILYLHSDFMGKMTDAMSKYSDLGFYLNHCYGSLLSIYLIDKIYFVKIFKYFKNMWRNGQNQFDTILYFIEWYVDERTASDNDLIEFFYKINLQNSNILKFFERYYSSDDFYIRIVMPFTAVTCADDVIKKESLRKDFSSVAQYFDRSYHDKPMTLSQLCRIVVRRTIFERNTHCSNAEKFIKLSELELPLTLKNFLFFNYSNFRMFEAIETT